MAELTILPTVIANIENKRLGITYQHLEVMDMGEGKYYPTPVGNMQVNLQNKYHELMTSYKTDSFISYTKPGYFTVYLSKDTVETNNLELGEDNICLIVLSPECYFGFFLKEAVGILNKESAEFVYKPLSPTRFELLFKITKLNFTEQPVSLLVPIIDGKPSDIYDTIREAIQVLLDLDCEQDFNKNLIDLDALFKTNKD